MDSECDGAEISLMTGPLNTFIVSVNDQLNNDGYISESKSTISFHEVYYTIRSKSKGKGKEILKGIDAHFRGGSLNVIIGPSGAGKTSILNILCGLKGKKEGVRGQFKINGTSTTPDALRKLSCYVPQEFELLPLLTARETLYFAAKLKILRADERQINALVNEVAVKLGLQDCLGTMTGDLSGGEKKRLSIGVEIVVNPMMLVLDEPTSGLDSAASIQVMTLLKNIAESDCTVVCSVHQPSSHMMTLFDEILVLADGRQLYCGPRNNIIETFGEAGFSCPPFYNISEFVIEVITGQHGGDLDELQKCSRKIQSHYLNKSQSVSTNVKEEFRKRANIKATKKFMKEYYCNWCNEFQVLMWRAVKCVIRDNTLTKLRLACHTIIGLFIGIVFYNFGGEASKVFSNIACIFFILLYLFFSNSMPAVQMFPIEAAVFEREHSNNWYSLGVYYLTKVLTDLPLQILCPTFFLAIAYYMTGQPMELDRFMKSWLICFLLCVLSQSFGMLIGAAVNTHIGCFLVPALNIPMSLFAGFFLKLNEVPFYLSIFSSVSYFRYAFEGFLQAIYSNRERLKCSADVCIFRSPERILNYMDMPSIEYSTAIYVLTAWIVLLHVSIYSILRWKFICKKG